MLFSYDPVNQTDSEGKKNSIGFQSYTNPMNQTSPQIYNAPCWD
jgi:hypothetical protein